MEQTQNLGRKRAMSVISLLYFLLIVALAVLSFFYTVKGSLLVGLDCHFRRCTGSHAVFEKTGADENMQRVAVAIFIAICAALFWRVGSTRPLGRDGSAGIFPMWLYRND